MSTSVAIRILSVVVFMIILGVPQESVRACTGCSSYAASCEDCYIAGPAETPTKPCTSPSETWQTTFQMNEIVNISCQAAPLPPVNTQCTATSGCCTVPATCYLVQINYTVLCQGQHAYFKKRCCCVTGS